MAHIPLLRKLTAPESGIAQAFLENSDSCAEGRRCMLWGGFSASIITALTAGIYFTSLMLAMGASETYIGYVTAIISFSGLFQLLSPVFLEKLPRRKPLLLGARIVYYLLDIVVIGVIPLFAIHNTVKLVLFMVTLILMHAINYIATPGISAWHMQSLPMAKRVSFYTVSNMGTSILNQVCAFLAGLLLDRFQLDSVSLFSLSPTMTAILLLRVIALLFAIFHCFCCFRIEEFPYEAPPAGKEGKGLRLLALPLRDRMFMRTILVVILWNFSTGVVGQYFSIYLLEDVKMSYSLISLAGFLSMPVTILSTPLWYRAIRKLSWPKLLAIGQFGNAVAYTCNAFITADTLYFYFLCIICGTFACTCVNIIHANLVYLHMPAANRTSYFSLYSILTLLAAFLGNYAGILFIQLTGKQQISLLGFVMGNKQYINLLSAFLFAALAVYTFLYGRKKEDTTCVI